jgi:hypothetical protein
MAWLILLVLVIGVALVGLNLVPPLLGIVLVLGSIMLAVAIADRRDRVRGGAAGPSSRLDRNTGSFHGAQEHWQPPTPYIDHRDGGGAPPGVEPRTRR